MYPTLRVISKLSASHHIEVAEVGIVVLVCHGVSLAFKLCQHQSHQLHSHRRHLKTAPLIPRATTKSFGTDMRTSWRLLLTEGASMRTTSCYALRGSWYLACELLASLINFCLKAQYRHHQFHKAFYHMPKH
jgi:hypothetical protein